VTAGSPFGPDGQLVLPQPLDVVRAEDAAPILEAARDEVTLLRLELAAVGDEVEAARHAAAAGGFDPEVVSAARRRLDDLVRAITDEADLHAAAVTAEAAAASAAILRRAEDHAHLLRTGGPLPTAPIAAPPPVAVPPTEPPAAVPALVPPAQVEQLLQQLLEAVSPAEADQEPAKASEPYSGTLGLLQVVTWSILVAAVLIVLLAWFA
jgi:hypothetical protein